MRAAPAASARLHSLSSVRGSGGGRRDACRTGGFCMAARSYCLPHPCLPPLTSASHPQPAPCSGHGAMQPNQRGSRQSSRHLKWVPCNHGSRLSSRHPKSLGSRGVSFLSIILFYVGWSNEVSQASPPKAKLFFICSVESSGHGRTILYALLVIAFFYTYDLKIIYHTKPIRFVIVLVLCL